jgi:hypothetical protein
VDFGVAGDDHATLSSGHGLIAEEAERGDIAKSAHMLGADARTEGLGAVFDEA